MLKLRDYQIKNANRGLDILRRRGIVYFAMEVRTGKTLTSLHTADLFGAKNVLFLTKKLAIKSIINDYKALQPNFQITVINNESLHKVLTGDFDLLISDEHHRLSSFPKPNKAAKMVRERFGHLPHIYLSGTPWIESGSQVYHSFWVNNRSPFYDYRNFYAWARDYTIPATRQFGAVQVNDYSKSIDSEIMPMVEPYMVRFTQSEAGFETEIKEKILYHELNPKIKAMVERLCEKLVIEGREEVVLADSPAKLMNKVHQIENGTIIFESGNSMVLDTSKAEFIRDQFRGQKMAIFYFFKKELDLLKQVFGESLTTDLDEFNSTGKHIALQQVSGSEGISLKAADVLVYYNGGYSGKLYTQGRDRMTTIDRGHNNVYFIFDKNGINSKIYRAIKSKKRYNEKMFKADYARVSNPKRNN